VWVRLPEPNSDRSVAEHTEGSDPMVTLTDDEAVVVTASEAVTSDEAVDLWSVPLGHEALIRVNDPAEVFRSVSLARRPTVLAVRELGRSRVRLHDALDIALGGQLHIDEGLDRRPGSQRAGTTEEETLDGPGLETLVERAEHADVVTAIGSGEVLLESGDEGMPLERYSHEVALERLEQIYQEVSATSRGNR